MHLTFLPAPVLSSKLAVTSCLVKNCRLSTARLGSLSAAAFTAASTAFTRSVALTTAPDMLANYVAVAAAAADSMLRGTL
jgi:hypothetical protein